MVFRCRAGAVVLALLTGCRPSAAEVSDDDGEDVDSGAEQQDAGAGDNGDEAESEESESGDEGSECSFVCDDMPSVDYCDPHDQDCPVGEKCSATALFGHNWDTNVCVPVVEDPVGVGEACMVLGEPFEGLDNCEVGSICWHADEQGQGECYAYCEGQNFECPESALCWSTGAGITNLCWPRCDPLLQDCAEGQTCQVGQSAFVCFRDKSNGQATYGTSCTHPFFHECNPGLVCAAAEFVPGCDGGLCCTELCNLDEVDACTDLGMGLSCIPLFEEALPDYEHVGLCGP